MTTEERIAQNRAVFEAIRDLWRADVGRMPRGHEPRLMDLVCRFGHARVLRAVRAVAEVGMRRHKERWAFFLALFGEAP